MVGAWCRVRKTMTGSLHPSLPNPPARVHSEKGSLTSRCWEWDHFRMERAWNSNKGRLGRPGKKLSRNHPHPW